MLCFSVQLSPPPPPLHMTVGLGPSAFHEQLRYRDAQIAKLAGEESCHSRCSQSLRLIQHVVQSVQLLCHVCALEYASAEMRTGRTGRCWVQSFTSHEASDSRVVVWCNLRHHLFLRPSIWLMWCTQARWRTTGRGPLRCRRGIRCSTPRRLAPHVASMSVACPLAPRRCHSMRAAPYGLCSRYFSMLTQLFCAARALHVR